MGVAGDVRLRRSLGRRSSKIFTASRSGDPQRRSAPSTSAFSRITAACSCATRTPALRVPKGRGTPDDRGDWNADARRCREHDRQSACRLRPASCAEGEAPPPSLARRSPARNSRRSIGNGAVYLGAIGGLSSIARHRLGKTGSSGAGAIRSSCFCRSTTGTCAFTGLYRWTVELVSADDPLEP